MTNRPRHFLALSDLSRDEIVLLLQKSRLLKQERGSKKASLPLAGKSVALLFEKPSTRTHISFDVAVRELGGHPVYLGRQTSQLGRGEAIADTARVLSRYVQAIVFRTFAQERLKELADHATVPVINALTDLLHPCQLLADLMTVQENKGDLKNLKIVWLGDGNNMANSWMEAARLFGFQLVLACPEGYDPLTLTLSPVGRGQGRGANIQWVRDPKEAVRNADVINADTWISMGQEGPKEKAKKKKFKPFQLNEALLKQAKKDCMVLHCLPAHRGEEITDAVLDGSQSRVWDQAENRLHVQKALLCQILS